MSERLRDSASVVSPIGFTTGTGVGLGSDRGFISSRDRRDQRFDLDDAGQIIGEDRKCHLAGDFAEMRHPVWTP